MKLKRIKKQNAIVLSNNGVEVLFSYETPVAAFIPGQGYIRTETFWSVTTSRHINQWTGPDATRVPQAELERLARETFAKEDLT